MLQGVYVANATPFRDDEAYSIDEDAYLAHVDWLASTGVTGVVPFGTNGEGPSVLAEEKLRVLERVFSRGGSLEVVPCAAEGSLPATLALVEALNELPARAILVLPPYYYRPLDAEGLSRFYAAVLERSRHPVVVYHIPRYGPPVPPEVVAGLPLWGVKDSGDDPEYARAIAAAGRGVLVGTEDLLWAGHGHGAAGAITGLGNFMPEQVVELHRRVRAGDQAGAEELAERVRRVRASEGPTWIAARKKLAEARHGVPMGTVRPPLPTVSEAYDPGVTLGLAGIAGVGAAAR